MSIRETFQKVRGKVLDVIQTSDDISGKNTIRRHLETWADITHDLEETAKALIGNVGHHGCVGNVGYHGPVGNVGYHGFICNVGFHGLIGNVGYHGLVGNVGYYMIL